MKNTQKNEQRTLEYTAKYSKEKLLKDLVNNNNPLIFDVGANVGEAANLFKTIWPNSKIHCFEPQKSCFNELEHTAKMFGNDIVVNKVGVGDKPQKNVIFYTHELSKGLAGLYKINVDSSDSIDMNKIRDNEDGGNLNNYIEKINKVEEIELIRLDDYINAKGLSNSIIDLLKIDTEGFEPEVLMGMGNKLANVRFILTEIMFYDYYEKKLSFSDIERPLIPYGFEIYDISHISKNPMNGRTDWVDVIYKKK
jgi:FkbM family methyltransferase